jgi:tetratricopeptide (TPR) repeat protein
MRSEYRGAALAQLKRSEEALACFDRALALKPDNPYFLYKRGSALSDLNRHEEAEREDSPWYPSARLFRQQTAGWCLS